MIERAPGDFGPIQPADEAIAELQRMLAADEPVTALHVGPAADLERKREMLVAEDQLRARIEEMEERLESLDPKPSFLHRPTPQETTDLMSLHRGDLDHPNLRRGGLS